MSSTITVSEKRTMPIIKEDSLRVRKSVAHPKFVRSASIEKIIKFNSYICSQNFYILPALLTWLKTGHSNLQPSLEKGLITLKFYLFTTYLYSAVLNKLYEAENSVKIVVNDTAHAPKTNHLVLSVAVYLTFVSLAFELFWCVYTLACTLLPSGLMFLCVCLYMICQINVGICMEFIEKQAKQEEIDAKPILNARKILGNRTISNFSLFFNIGSKKD